MTKINNIIGYGTSKLNTYKFTFNEKVIMLDFGYINLTKEDVSDVDYLFISHEHGDHCGNLKEYKITKFLKEDIRIFTSVTTKELITCLLKHQTYTKDAKVYMDNLWDKIEGCFYNEEYKIDNNIKFKFFKSGHTFGSSMIYIYDDTESLLFTGDFDYNKRNYNRQYEIPAGLHVDTLIVDGTNLISKPFKGVKTDDIIDYALRKKKEIDYKVRVEKGVLYAHYLVKNKDNLIILFDKNFKWYLDILSKNGYDPYIPGKIMYRLPGIDYKKIYKDKSILNFHPVITEKYIDDSSLTDIDDNLYSLDQKLGLHITASELENFIDSFENHPSKILIGHFKFDNENKLNLCKFKNASLLHKGENHYG